MSADFSPAGYRALVGGFLQRGYAVRDFASAEPARPHLVLRHDVDMSLGAALALARLERDLDVAATYFVMVRSGLYNALAPDNARAVRELVALGHVVGLHLDAALYDAPESLERGAARECVVLEQICEREVSIVSLHRPGPAASGLEVDLAGRPHTYQARYVSAMGYCSDSRGAWHHGHPLDHRVVAEGRALQLLTHPVWWQEGGGTPRERLARYLDGRFAELDRELAEQCAAYVSRGTNESIEENEK